MEQFWLSPPHHTHLAACLQAVSLATLALEFCSIEILQSARRQYSLTLHLTNRALLCPHIAQHNATLLTVILLYMYEKLTESQQNNASDGWKHLDGALTILQLSGASQFNDAIRLQLFRQVSMCILLRCLRRGEDLPPGLLSLRKFVDPTDKDGQLEGLLMKFTELKIGTQRGDILGCDIDVELKQLDFELLQICTEPPRWKFSEAMAGYVPDKEFFISLIESINISL